MVNIKIMCEDQALLPTKNNTDDAGWDLYAEEDIYFSRNQSVKIPTGIYLEIPKGYYGQIVDRSSMGSKGIHVHGGLIDSGYRGPVIVCLHNHNSHYMIKKGDRIAQLVILPVPEVQWEVVDSLGDSERGEKGFGSSGL